MGGMAVFGFVTANMGELTPEQKDRYTAVYCGICRNIRSGSSNLCRCCLSYDVALLALVLMSLYEPEETVGDRACMLHPIHPRPWTENEFTRYAADMNVALAYYNAVDDWYDDRKLSAKAAASVLEPHLGAIRERYPRHPWPFPPVVAQSRSSSRLPRQSGRTDSDHRD